MSITENLLNKPWFYNLIQILLGLDFYKVAANHIKKYPHLSVLEFGCGTGEILKEIKFKKYLGTDISEKYINHAKQKFESKNRKFQILDATKIKKIKGNFDLVLLINFIHHLTTTQLKKVMAGIKKNIKYKKIIIIDSKPDFGIFTALLEKGDLGNNFRNLHEIENITKKYFKIEKAYILKKFYWPYQYPFIVGSKK